MKEEGWDGGCEGWGGGGGWWEMHRHPHQKIEILVIFWLISCHGNQLQWVRLPILCIHIEWSVFLTFMFKRHDKPWVCNRGTSFWGAHRGKNADFEDFCIQLGVKISKNFLKFFLVVWHILRPLVITKKLATWGFCRRSWSEGRPW